MSEQFFKCVRWDYGSFHHPYFKYGPVGTTVTHPDPITNSRDAADYISVSTSPTDCTGFSWRVNGKDSRLLVVEPVGDVWTPHAGDLPNQRAATAVRVVGELPITAALGPNGDQVTAFLALLPALTAAQWAAAWDAARDAASDAAWAAARDAAWDAASDAARDAASDAAWAAARAAAWDAAWDAAWAAARAAEAIAVRDLITPEQFEILTGPMRTAGIDFDKLEVSA